ncbi:FAD-dependent oxidoreductase [Arthrobacter sp. CDRTa11]|uniref:FAD-dependent oxidoreductase n=1 Tax=Arthrobacter sp. CDRTa11 TaxID=2651199 RepID=UPI002265F4B2|nr:FAD-dependent oxidoreductase [Arthrobacter sp. CDRTa11]UZX03106.1 FAD-dependent oxidoreductase [Arthrobacter sp. CDRTa11]
MTALSTPDGPAVDQQVDVVLIGAGASGLSCVIEAAGRGARVTVIDAAPSFGGTASGAAGGTCIAGSPLQDRLGVEDSVGLALEDWITWGGDSVDVEWAHRYLLASRDVFFDHLSALGVRWISIHPHEGNRVPRWHRPEGGGKRVMSLLAHHARALPNITWRFGYRAQELVRSGGRITAVIAMNGDRIVEISAPAIVMATGGFNNSAELVAMHAKQAAGAERVLLGGGPEAKGEGIRMLEAVGAQFTELDSVWMYPYGTPDYLKPGTDRGLAVRGVDGELWINDEGNRFHDESLRGGASGTGALLAQTEGRAWSVFDAGVASGLILADPYYLDGNKINRDRVAEFLRSSPYVESAPSAAALAARIGVDRRNLEAAINDMNKAIAAGLHRDPAFGKPLDGIAPLDEAPFYAVRLHPLARKNLGGVRTDLDCRVLDSEGRPIDGLFASGEVAGMAGGHINGHAALEGTAFGPSVFSGIVAGRAVVE